MSCLASLPLSYAQYYAPPCTVNVTINYSGAGSVTPGSGSYGYGTTVVFRETTNPGYSFNGWYLNGIYEGNLSSIPITIYQSYQLIAVYSLSQTWLTIYPSSQGTTNPSAGLWHYNFGSVITITESPNSGNTFSGWYLDGTFMGTTTNLTLTMNQDHQVNAFFAGGNNISTSPTPSPMPTPTSNPNLLSPTLQFYCTSSSSSSAFNVELQGNLIYNNSGINDEGILFSYSVTNGATWQDLAYIKTGNFGNFSAVWMPSASGNYVIRAVYLGDSIYSPISSTVNFAVNPAQNQNQNVFSVTSNSTLTSLVFDSTHNSLSFGVSGTSGTTGYAQICVPKSLLPDVATLQITLDNSTISYSSFSSGNVWLITIYYHHSSHNVVMALSPQTATPTPTSTSTATSTPTPPSTQTQNPTNNPTSSPTPAPSPSPSPSATSTPVTPEFPLLLLPLFLIMVGFTFMILLKKHRKTTA